MNLHPFLGAVPTGLCALALASSLFGCASNFQIDETNAAQIFDRFQYGAIHLGTSESASKGSSGTFSSSSYRVTENHLDDMFLAYSQQNWSNLAKIAITANSADDASYFYLGVAAENLGYKSAAIDYFRQSIAASERRDIFADLPPGVPKPANNPEFPLSFCVPSHPGYRPAKCHSLVLPDQALEHLAKLQGNARPETLGAPAGKRPRATAEKNMAPGGSPDLSFVAAYVGHQPTVNDYEHSTASELDKKNIWFNRAFIKAIEPFIGKAMLKTVQDVWRLDDWPQRDGNIVYFMRGKPHYVPENNVIVFVNLGNGPNDPSANTILVCLTKEPAPHKTPKVTWMASGKTSASLPAKSCEGLPMDVYRKLGQID